MNLANAKQLPYKKSKTDHSIIFLLFAFGYLFSSLVRGITATLAPVLTQEFTLTSGELGLLAGAYFLGFALLQLPLGNWLDRYGPRKVLAVSLVGAVLSCVAFAFSNGLGSLLAARVIGGIGVSACLIAPLTAARIWLPKDEQQSVNSWMLMAGSLGLIASTLPVQWLLPSIGWRALFLILAALFLSVLIGIFWKVPGIDTLLPKSETTTLVSSYRPIFGNPYFQRMGLIGFFNYGTLVAVQTLWAGPWMTTVTGYSAAYAATGLFAINLTMLIVFWIWGLLNPWLYRSGITADQLLTFGLPLGFLSLAAIAWMGFDAGWISLALYCALSSFLALTHPAVGLAFPPSEAGRAISAFNLLLFLGIFFTQWFVGVLIDQLTKSNWLLVDAYRATFLLLALASALSYLFFIAGQYRSSRTSATQSEAMSSK